MIEGQPSSTAAHANGPLPPGCQVRGCCCGIPFGCGSVLSLFALGALFWQHVSPEVLLFVAGALALAVGAAFVLANRETERPRWGIKVERKPDGRRTRLAGR